jgi:hypothetical protein
VLAAPVWQATTMLVGHVGDAHRRFGLVDVLAAGAARAVHVGRRSAGLMSMSMSSSTSGDTNTEVKLVWRRLSESNGDLRTRRCTPVSVFSQP